MAVCTAISPLRWGDTWLCTIHSPYYSYQLIHHHVMKKGNL